MGYHSEEIPKGVYGEVSKVEEELAELKDAVAQGNHIMALVELSDMVGAMRGFLQKHFPCIEFSALVEMANATERAFLSGGRK